MKPLPCVIAVIGMHYSITVMQHNPKITPKYICMQIAGAARRTNGGKIIANTLPTQAPKRNAIRAVIVRKPKAKPFPNMLLCISFTA